MSQYEPQRFAVLPPMVKHLLIINTLAYFANYVLQMRGIPLNAICGLWDVHSPFFRLWQPVTYMFMHGNFSHLFFNMFSLWMFGCVLERYWGSRRFLFYYLACGIGGGLLYLLVPGAHLTVGASAAIYALLLAFGMLFPNEYIYLYFLVPIKTKWFIVGMIAIELLLGVFQTADHVAHFAHLSGMLIGLVLILYWRKHPFSKF
ncbi:MAG: rhomboid family intramembrane serine protease [Bacteroidales bacterium]|nr:rhomboid family intramembrane serine protease [Bacteroidales bacterium]